MKTILPLFICLSLFWSCKQEKTTSESELEPVEKKITTTAAETSGTSDPTILKTSTGKSIKLIID